MMYAKRRFILLSTAFLMAGGLSAEVFPGRNGFDSYGGYLGIKGTATGRFHLETIGERHFLVTPDGHGFISIGVTHTGGLAEPEDSRCDHFKENLGGDWEKANAELVSLFRQCGYNSLGYGGHSSTRKLYPHFASCQPTGKVSSWMGKQVEYPDVFSDAWKEQARNSIERMKKQYGGNPNLIGIYWQDMPAWDLKLAKRQTGRTWVDAIRALPKNAPGKKRYERFLRENGADASDAEFLVLIAREIYTTIGPLTRKLFPDTLVFGERYAGRALPWKVIVEALPWIDAMAVQPDGAEFPAETLERLYRETGKPVMICDHNVSFNTPEHSNVMWQTLPDVGSVGRAHAKYMEAGFATPYLLGYNRCQYIDRYKAGQKILKQGLLQVDGTPYKGLVDSVRKNNWRVHEGFLAASGGRK
ncbi:MAG: hypothetical protein K9M45_05705 [Kiritimatiellales bacterium]|nr:hypothetical protein [Kiritimatiellales bacterium]